MIEEALVAIGCPKTADLTRRAIEALDIPDGVTGEKAEAVIVADDETVREALEACDAGYYDNDEPIADRLFAWIKRNKDLVRVGSA